MKTNMNKKVKIAIIAGIAVVAVVVALVLIFCGGISDDPYEARDTLIDNGYNAEIYAKGPDVDFWKIVNGIDAQELEYVICAYPIVDSKDVVVSDQYVAEDVIYVFYFKDQDAADNAFNAIEAFMQQFASQNPLAQGMEIDQSGEMIWFGTPDAISAAK